MATQVRVDVPGILSELEQIGEQLSAEVTTNREAVAFAKWLESTAVVKIKDACVAPWAEGTVSDGIAVVTESLAAWADRLRPEAASVTWDREDVKKKLALLDSLSSMTMLTEEQELSYKTVADKLASVRRAGNRGSPQAPIAGRPAKVRVSVDGEDGEPVVISEQVGNVQNSLGNIKAHTKKHLETALDRKADEAEMNGLNAAIRAVIYEGKATAAFGGFTFEAVEL